MAVDPQASAVFGKIIRVFGFAAIILIIIRGILEILFGHLNKKIDQLADFLGGKLKKSNGNRCPYCGGILIEKSGQYGRFLGCSSYPKCRYTKKIN
jgi:hypothetical protein